MEWVRLFPFPFMDEIKNPDAILGIKLDMDLILYLCILQKILNKI